MHLTKVVKHYNDIDKYSDHSPLKFNRNRLFMLPFSKTVHKSLIYIFKYKHGAYINFNSFRAYYGWIKIRIVI